MPCRPMPLLVKPRPTDPEGATHRLGREEAEDAAEEVESHAGEPWQGLDSGSGPVGGKPRRWLRHGRSA